LKIDVDTMQHGGEVAKRLRGDRSGGIPWITIVNGDATELVTSDGPNGNIGCPITEDECAWFVKMIERTIQHAPDGRVAEIAKALDAYAQTRR
jgi:hypothetical protein